MDKNAAQAGETVALEAQLLGRAIVYTTPDRPSREQIEEIAALWQERFPGRQVIVIPAGSRLEEMPEVAPLEIRLTAVETLLAQIVDGLSDLAEQQGRIADHLLTLAKYLADEDGSPDGDEPAFDLDGNRIGAERDAGTPL
jgi:hypothetical protein